MHRTHSIAPTTETIARSTTTPKTVTDVQSDGDGDDAGPHAATTRPRAQKANRGPTSKTIATTGTSNQAARPSVTAKTANVLDAAVDDDPVADAVVVDLSLRPEEVIVPQEAAVRQRHLENHSKVMTKAKRAHAPAVSACVVGA